MMKKPASVKGLEEFGRVRLSNNFFMREFLYSEIANFHAMPNIPDNPELAIRAGTKLCEELLEPLQDRFGRLAVRSAYRSPLVNGYGNEHGYNCASNEANRAGHIWDQLDANGKMGATTSVVIPWFADQYERGADWRALAWWIHDHLPYSDMEFFPKRAAFNISWHEDPKRQVYGFANPRGFLTRKGMENWEGSHAAEYAWFGTDKY